MTCLSSTVCTTTRARLRGALRSTQPPYPPQVPVTSAANLMPTNLSHINPSTPDVRNASRIAIFEALIISALPVNASFRNVCAAVDICRIVGLVDPDASFRKGAGRDCRERRGESQIRNFHSENPFIHPILSSALPQNALLTDFGGTGDGKLPSCVLALQDGRRCPFPIGCVCRNLSHSRAATLNATQKSRCSATAAKSCSTSATPEKSAPHPRPAARTSSSPTWSPRRRPDHPLRARPWRGRNSARRYYKT